MNYNSIFLLCVSVVFALKQDKFRLSEEKQAKVKKISEECAYEHKVDPGLFPRIAEGSLSRDETTNKYIHCFAIKSGLVDEVGHIIINKLASLAESHPRIEEFKTALSKCNEVTKENPVATVVYMNECYAKTSPILLVFH